MLDLSDIRSEKSDYVKFFLIFNKINTVPIKQFLLPPIAESR